jgi:hypothetical protein
VVLGICTALVMRYAVATAVVADRGTGRRDRGDGLPRPRDQGLGHRTGGRGHRHVDVDAAVAGPHRVDEAEVDDVHPRLGVVDAAQGVEHRAPVGQLHQRTARAKASRCDGAKPQP